MALLMLLYVSVSTRLFSCSVGWSPPPATFGLALGVEASDAGVDLGSLILVDPPRRYPFG
jgi:hypothetical protein